MHTLQLPSASKRANRLNTAEVLSCPSIGNAEPKIDCFHISLQIRVAKHAAIAPGRGSRFHEHVSIAHADPDFHKKPYYSNVAVLAADGSEWYANVRLLFPLTDQRGRNRNLVFVRYLEEYRVPDATTCKRLSWAKYVHRGQHVEEWYDVVELKSILRTVYLVKDWNREGGFYLNSFKWSSEKRYKGNKV
jgi:hypothetical protein